MINKKRNMRFLILALLLIASCKQKKAEKTQELDLSESKKIEVPLPAASNNDRSITAELMSLVNDHRRRLGLSPIQHSDPLAVIARTHSQNMAAGRISFGHSGFSERCSKAREVLGGGNLCGENVAKGQKTAQAVFDSWLSSSGHRANIEGSRFTHSGLGYEQSSSGTFYWTHLFFWRQISY